MKKLLSAAVLLFLGVTLASPQISIANDYCDEYYPDEPDCNYCYENYQSPTLFMLCTMAQEQSAFNLQINENLKTIREKRESTINSLERTRPPRAYDGCAEEPCD